MSPAEKRLADRRDRDLDAVMEVVRTANARGYDVSAIGIRDALGIGIGTVHTRMKRLIDLGLVERTGSIGRHPTYGVAP